MKLIKQIALSIFLVSGIFFGILYSSCSKDACKTVNCLHGGTCSGGQCSKCDSGTGGTNCQIIYRDSYVGNYTGNAVVSYTNIDSAYMDSGYVNHTDDSNIIQLQPGADTAYALMQLTWTDGHKTMLTTPIVLVNNTSTGSTFTISGVRGGPGDTFTVSGNGNVSGTNASLNLTAVPPHPAISPTINYTLSNCSRQ